MEEQWINDLRKKMASHQTPVPPGLWEDIESALKPTLPAPVSLRKRITLWASGIGSIAAAVALAFLLYPSTEPATGIIAPRTLTAQTAAPAAVQGVQPAHEPLLALSASSGAVPQQKADMGTSPLVSSEISIDKVVSKTDDSSAAADVPPEPQSRNMAGKESKEKSRSAEEKKTSFKTFADTQHAALLATAAGPKKKAWDLDVYTAHLPHSAHQTNGYSEFVAGTALPQDFSSTLSPVKELIYSNLGKEIETQKKHRLPLRFGISARYHLNSRWSIESGLTYTYLSSELTSGTDAHHFVTEQRLQYLGLPLMVGYDLWKNKTWNLYLSGGGVLEKCIHGRSKTHFVIDRQQVASTEKAVMEHPLQCSVLGTLGAQLHLSSHIALYAEPGVSYYFDNGSAVETIYKDHPLNFTFKLGFRFLFR